jgi:AcrR family transcriptional regulator
MGTRERQEREREIVRQAIVDAARELFVADGFAKVSIRKIAERIEYSPAAIYSYFPSKDDIFFALAEEGFRLLCDGLANDDAERDPLAFIRRALNALYRFSQAHPEYYALMFLDRSVPNLKDSQDRMPGFRDMANRLVRAVERCLNEGIFPQRVHASSVFRLLTTAVHGAATANVCGRLREGQRGDALAHDLIELTIAGLRAGVPLTFVGTPPGDALHDTETAARGPEPVES